ncbi:MAG: glucokinase [Desulfovibrionaceae bacterium]
MAAHAGQPPRILAADIGGTSCRFAHFTRDAAGRLRLLAKVSLATAGLGSQEGLLDALAASGLDLAPGTVDAAVFAVPGAVVNRRVHFANIDWTLDLDRLEAAFGPGRVACINDFIGQALGCLSEAADDALVVRPGEMDPDKVRAVIGAGTGLGMAALIPGPAGGVTALPSEGGQSEARLRDLTEQAFARFLCRLTGEHYARYDSVLSGSGLARLHLFLTGHDLLPAAVAERLTPESQTATLFAGFFGRAVRDYALTVLATGGIYICGGVAAKNPLLVRHEAFAREFLDSPTYGDLLATIPICLVHHMDTGLYGAARHALTLLSPNS